MKLTVYIVDDEPMAIRYLEMLLKGTTQKPEVIGTAPNGVKALKEIDRLHPDFVFADISMPVMDGLEMSEEILKQNPAQKIFLLTAYRDFEYAKKSVSIGVADYILKNELSEQILDDLICKHMEDLEAERRRQHTIKENNLRNFFLSGSPSEADEEFYQDKPLQRYVLFYIAPKPVVVLKHPEQRHEGYDHADCFEIENSIAEPDMICRAFFQMFRNEYCGVFFALDSAGDIEWKCRRIAEDIMKRFGSQLSDHICLISSPGSQFSMLKTIYNRLHNMTAFLYGGKKKIYLESEILPQKIPEGRMNQKSWTAQWKQILENGDPLEADEYLKEQFKSMKACHSIWEYTEEIQEICRCLKELHEEKKFGSQILNLKEFYQDAELLEKEIRESQFRYLEEQRERRENRYSRHVVLAQEYIRNHYKDVISVADIAEAAGVSEGHLRRCFKNEMNVSVLNYLTDYRLNYAKILMKNGTENIEEIWKNTGFMSAQYFSCVFKKREGITPRDYMRQMNGEGGKGRDE